ncbi:hypothetical protein DEW08_26110 (plasmid) [Azospirillum thermophilum]|uniref:Uncharacterized protein n=1 Tax=Azospirillum thermophilum TaxID=2202148 RepID=A0A2S2CYF5_9PROT|nr:hypothetical protein DEW08_26110 [Azospirillum thermophilum]
MACRVQGPRSDLVTWSTDKRFWLGCPPEFDSVDAAVIFVMERAPARDLDRIEIHTDGGELYTILAIARRYRELAAPGDRGARWRS